MILISGFGPFKDFKINPSETLVEAIKLDNVKSIVLPVEYKNAFTNLKAEIDRLNPKLIIMFGLAQSRTKISVEKYAYNLNDCTLADTKGVLISSRLINPNTKKKLIESDFQITPRNEKWEQSEDPGRYVCNDLYYRVLDYTANKKIKACFIHLPLETKFNLVKEIETFLIDCLNSL